MKPNDKMRGKRLVDRIRDGAGRAEIPPGHGNVLRMKAVGERAYFLAERGLTSGVMADRIDPDRVNPDIPFIVQRVELSYGVEHPFMQRTVCLAFELIDPTYLPEHVNKDAALSVAVEVATGLASVMDVVAELKSHQADVHQKAQAGLLHRGYLPKTANLKGKVQQCLADLREVDVALKKTVCMFYPKDAANDPWDAKLKPFLLAEHGGKEGFEQHISDLWTFMQGAQDHRHAMVHPNNEKSVVIRDYELEAGGDFVAPTIEIIHPRSRIERRDITQFLESQVDKLSFVYENILAYLCDLNVRRLNDFFESFVARPPNGERRNGALCVWQTRLRDGFEMVDGAIRRVEQQPLA